MEAQLFDAPAVQNNDLKIGDVVLFTGNAGLAQQGVLLHSATYIGFGLIFEKGNPGAEYVFRIGYLSDVIKKYKDQITGVEISFARPKDMQKPIPSPQASLTLLADSISDDFKNAVLNLPDKLKGSVGISEIWNNQSFSSDFFASFVLPIDEIPINKFKDVISIYACKS